MKKIVGIIAAVAMAASVFAVDFSANVKVEGSLFDMKFADGAKPSALSVSKAAGGMYWGSRFQTAFYGDKAGAQFAIGGELGWGWQGASVWVQPSDMVKITFLNTDSKLNQIFDYSGDEATFKAEGSWNFELKPVDGLTFNLVLGSPWLNNGVIGDTGFVAKYAADFGTIGAIFKIKQNAGSPAVPAKAGEWGWVDADNDPSTEPIWKKGEDTAAVPAKDTTTDIAFGVGFTGKADSVSYFIDAGLNMPNKDMILVTEAQVVAALNPVTISAYVLYKNNLKSKADFAVANELKLRAKVEYQMDAAKLYLCINDADILLPKGVNMEIKPGVEFNIGAAHCDIGALMTIDATGAKANVGLSLPFYAEVAF